MISTEDYLLFVAPLAILVFAVVMTGGFFLFTRKLRAKVDLLRSTADRRYVGLSFMQGSWSAKAGSERSETRTATPQR